MLITLSLRNMCLGSQLAGQRGEYEVGMRDNKRMKMSLYCPSGGQTELLNKEACEKMDKNNAVPDDLVARCLWFGGGRDALDHGENAKADGTETWNKREPTGATADFGLQGWTPLSNVRRKSRSKRIFEPAQLCNFIQTFICRRIH